MPPPTTPAPAPAKAERFRNNVPFVRALAAAVQRALHLRTRVELAELVSFGAIGLGEAIDRWDPERGCSFRAWARWRIVGAMYDGLRTHGILRRGRAVARAEAAPELTARPPERPEFERGDEPRAAPEGSPDEVFERADLRARLAVALDGLDSRERRLLEVYYWREEHLSEAAEAIGVSVPWASRLHARAVGRLRRALGVGDDDP